MPPPGDAAPTPEEQLTEARARLEDAGTQAAEAVSDAREVVSAEAQRVADAIGEAGASAAAAATEAADAVRGLAEAVVTDPGPEVKPAGSAPDSRFDGLKVVVAGATGGVGR